MSEDHVTSKLPSEIADAAMAAWAADDLAPMAALMGKLGAKVKVSADGGDIAWSRTPSGIAGGVSLPTDPITALVSMLFAIAGVFWPMVPESRLLFEEVDRRWRDAARDDLIVLLAVELGMESSGREEASPN